MLKSHHTGAIPDFYARGFSNSSFHVHQSRPSPTGFDGQAAPESEFTVDLESLTAIHRYEPDAFVA